MSRIEWPDRECALCGEIADDNPNLPADLQRRFCFTHLQRFRESGFSNPAQFKEYVERILEINGASRPDWRW